MTGLGVTTLNLEDGSAEDELPDDRRDHRWIGLVGHVTVPVEDVDPSIGK